VTAPADTTNRPFDPVAGLNGGRIFSPGVSDKGRIPAEYKGQQPIDEDPAAVVGPGNE